MSQTIASVSFFGDVHGQLDHYADMISDLHESEFAQYANVENPHESLPDDRYSVQVGDMGLGFHAPSDDSFRELDTVVWEHHKFIRGNHDDPALCHEMKSYLGDYGIWSIRGLDILFVGGARSIDAAYRKQLMLAGVQKCWWEDEQLTDENLNKAISLNKRIKPQVIVTHDMPFCQYDNLAKWKKPSRTADALTRVFEAHQPQFWFFGHFHKDRSWESRGTRFVCVGERSRTDLLIREDRSLYVTGP